jgi:hypothetical protein
MEFGQNAAFQYILLLQILIDQTSKRKAGG